VDRRRVRRPHHTTRQRHRNRWNLINRYRVRATCRTGGVGCGNRERVTTGCRRRPVSAPETGSRLRPGGRLPALTLRDGAGDPVAWTVAAYADPTTPFGNESVVIAGTWSITTVYC